MRKTLTTIEKQYQQELVYFLIELFPFGRAPVDQSVATWGCQSRGCEFDPQLGQHSFRRLTKVTVTCVVRLKPMVQISKIFDIRNIRVQIFDIRYLRIRKSLETLVISRPGVNIISLWKN